MKVISLQSALLTAMLAIAFVAASHAGARKGRRFRENAAAVGPRSSIARTAMACQAKVIVGISPCRDSPASNPST